MAVIEGETLDGARHVLKVTKRTRDVFDDEPLRALDIGALAAAPNLRKIRLGPASRIDLDPALLHAFAELRTLELGVAEVPDFGRWPGCPLESLGLTLGEGAADLAPLAACSKLVRLNLVSDADQLDLSPLAELPIETVNLCIRRVQSVDWTSLGRMAKLRALGVTMPRGAVVDLNGLDALRELRLSEGDYRALDLSPLHGRHLERLTIFGNDALADLAIHEVAGPALSSVIVKSRGVDRVSLSGFETATALRNLDLGDTSLRLLDVNPLLGLRRVNVVSVPAGCRLIVDPLVDAAELRNTSTGLWNLLCDQIV